MIKISVVVPVYNVEKYLEKCLKSIIKQSLKEIEIIIVNDGTKDNSAVIIDKYKKKYPKLIRSFKKKNGGLSSARNYGINRAKGDYIICIDSDDYIKPDMLKTMYNKAIKDDLDVVVANVFIKSETQEYEIKANLKYSNDVLRNYLISYPMATIRLVKKELYLNNQFKEGILYEDLELLPSLLLKTNKIDFIDKPLYYYVKRPGSIMNKKVYSNKMLDIFTVLESIENKFREAKKYNEYKEEIEYLYITHLLRSATLNLVDLENTKEVLEKINTIFKTRFPDYRKNIYYKKSSKKLKILCFLSYNKNYKILKLIKKKFRG